MPATQEGLAELVEREGLRDERIAAAFRDIDRAGFVPDDFVLEAYVDRPVPLPQGQTTSQPTLIARMVDAASVGKDDVVLEVGTGYGFQTAVLARLCRRVVSIERHGLLVEAARANLARAGIDNARVLLGDGWQGCPEEAPFDGIVVSAAASELPAPLADQLGDGGRMVVPLARGGSDDVILFVKSGGTLQEARLVTPARFVPLVSPEQEGRADA